MSKNDTRTIKVGIAATVVGAAAGAAGVYLSDKKNRQKAAKQLDKAKKWSDKTLDDWKDKVDGLKVDDKVEQVKHIANDKIKDLKEKMQEDSNHMPPQQVD